MKNPFRCSGESLAHDAAEGNQVECARCHQLFADTDLIPVNAKQSICPECLREVTEENLDK